MLDYLKVAADITRSEFPVSQFRQPEERTHWIEFDAPSANGGALASCNALVPAESFSTQPTCPDCAEYLRRLENSL